MSHKPGEQAMPVTFEDIDAAAGRIAPHAVVTPLLEAPLLNQRLGGRLLVKAECLQTTGSFKLRGALNRIAQLNTEERARGVVAYSSGNHAQAVAYAASVFGTTAIIVMPKDAPATKIEKTRRYGGEVVLYDRYTEDRAAIGAEIASTRGGMTLIPPFDDRHVIAGQGTVALETVAQADAMGARIDAFLVCCSGGGLTAGCALAFEALSPDTALYGVEPEGFDDTLRSLKAGERVSNDPALTSICDAVITQIPGEVTFPINQRLLDGVLVVSDDEALTAMRVAAEDLKLIVEPGGAVAFAAAVTGKIDLQGKTVAAVASGGNADLPMLMRALETEREHSA